MPNQSKQDRRRQRIESVRSAEKPKAESELPALKEDLKELIDTVDKRVGDNRCDHTMRHTVDFIRERGMDEERVIAWLHRYGGYCDCEVVMNVDNSCPAMK